VPRRIVVFVVLAVALAAVFVRLGFWQVDRLRQRRARNAVVSARFTEPAVPIERVSDTASYRRVTVNGTPDYAHEIVLTGRSRNGSPGVYFLTPVRLRSSDSAVIVIRGWAYSPDAATIDAERWREARDSFSGYAVELPHGPVNRSRGERAIRTLTMEGVRAFVPYALSSRYVISQDQSADTAPARLPPPALDEGPHLSYAIQWFSFAAIALIGAAVVAARARVSPQYGSGQR
jgi:surfeit locus 1 family protein